MIRLPFNPTQAEYDAWHVAYIARANDPDDPTHPVDVTDAITVFATAHEIAKAHPELADKLAEHTPEAVEMAGGELGIFMGVTRLANLIGLDPKEARQTVSKVWK